MGAPVQGNRHAAGLWYFSSVPSRNALAPGQDRVCAARFEAEIYALAWGYGRASGPGLFRLLFLPLRFVGGAAATDSRSGAARHYTERGADTAWLYRLSWHGGLRVGQVCLRSLGRYGGGRRNFLGGMAGSIFFTIIFALSGGFPLFTLAWIGNRLFQSQGWAGLVRVSSRWFSYSTYGSVMAVVSLSFLFGDAGCRWALSELMAHGVGWRGVFFFSAASLAVADRTNCCFCARRREERGLPAPEVNPRNVYAGEEPGRGRRAGCGRGDSAAAADEFCFLDGVPAGVWDDAAARDIQPVDAHLFCAVCRAFGECGGEPQRAVSAVRRGFSAAGRVSERQAGRERAQHAGGDRDDGVHGMPGADVAACRATAAHGRRTILVGLVGFTLLGPYSYLAGAMSLDFGGQRGSATAAGIIDGFGYMAGWLSGDTVARISVAFGWRDAFLALAGVSLLTALVALVLTAHQRNHTVQRA